jgi:S1-C subfamily serine protease
VAPSRSLSTALLVASFVAQAAFAKPHDRARTAGKQAAPAAPLTEPVALPGLGAPPGPGARPEDLVEAALARTVLLEGDGIYGSGVLVAPRKGLLITSGHVIDEMKQIRVTFFDGRTGTAKVLEVDKTLDLAILEGPAVDLPPLPLGDAQALRPAETLYAIGAPRKLGFTVSRGIVSYVGRKMDGARYIQTDLAINEGNSGGPVLNARGELVGIMSFILRRANGLAFAMPVSYAVERFASRLPEDGTRAAYLDRFRVWKGRP